MAISRVDPKQIFKIIAEGDSALVNEGPIELAKLIAEGKTSRYQEYLDKLDESKLQFKEGDKPTQFVIRCLLPTEKAAIEQKYSEYDFVTKRMKISKPSEMMHEYFTLGCLGIQKDDGSIEKVTPDDLGEGAAMQIGSVVSIYTALGKNLKK